jgi:hypothetical protein
MKKKNPLQHAREAWGQDHNPFPAAAIAEESSQDDPYDGDILAEDRDRFIEKLIVKAVLPPGREFGYLWSQGRTADTGYGKTRLMLETKKALNRDFGHSVAHDYGLREGTKMAAVWASMKTIGITGIYPLLFNAIVDAANSTNVKEPSLIERCWTAIAAQAKIEIADTQALEIEVEGKIKASRRKLFPGFPELRDDILDALISCDPDAVLTGLEAVSHASRARNGLAYFEAFYCLVRAAGIEHLFVFIDQLEDLATATKIPRATRQREVGRFRDIFAETAGFKGHCHAAFTFHRRAANALADFWHAERINPPFEPEHPIGRNAAVVLQGLKTTHQVERLLAIYLDSVREKPTGNAEPFDASTFQLLLERSDGRIGMLLPEASALWDRAADEQVPVITAQFVSENLPAQEDAPVSTEGVSDEDTLKALWNR